MTGHHEPARPGEPAPAPGQPPVATSFDEEIRSAVSYERGLAVKCLLALALVAVILALRVYFFG
ncbi:MAG TPA: hypothetical protein VMI33_00870 [Streptosporangiaceae bacterium]|nr:hypothetical protein [Streptosporangiaceae bacterium]